MAKKQADADHTPDAAIQKMAALPRLDDDTRWLPIEAARQRLSERTNDAALTIDLEKALADGRLPCMLQSTATGERKFVLPTAWTDPDQIMLDDTRDGVRVIFRQPLHQSPGGSYVVRPFRGGRFFIWAAALNRVWPPPAGTAPVDRDDDDARDARVSPGPQPRGNWPMLVTQWLFEVAVEDKKRLQNVDELVEEAKIFLHNQIKWAPKDDKVLRAKIRELLKRVRH